MGTRWSRLGPRWTAFRILICRLVTPPQQSVERVLCGTGILPVKGTAHGQDGRATLFQGAARVKRARWRVLLRQTKQLGRVSQAVSCFLAHLVGTSRRIIFLEIWRWRVSIRHGLNISCCTIAQRVTYSASTIGPSQRTMVSQIAIYVPTQITIINNLKSILSAPPLRGDHRKIRSDTCLKSRSKHPQYQARFLENDGKMGSVLLS